MKTMSPQMKKLLIRIAAFLIVMLVGALLFMVIEGRREDDTATVLTVDEIRDNFLASYNVSERDFELLVEAVRNNTYFSNAGIPWTFGNSLYFVVVLITTIGYGHVAPQTWQGQLFCIFYSLFGIPITALMLKSVGEYITLAITRTLFFFEKRLLKREPEQLETKCFIISLFLMVLMLIMGATFTNYSEDWTMMEGVYFIFVTLTTIGFGDYIINDGRILNKSPTKTSITCISLIFLILGLGVVSSVLCSISQLIETGGLSCCKRRRTSEDNADEKIDSTKDNMELTSSNHAKTVT